MKSELDVQFLKLNYMMGKGPHYANLNSQLHNTQLLSLKLGNRKASASGLTGIHSKMV